MSYVKSSYIEEINDDEVIYRYMDFAKFVNLLQTKKIHFHKASDFGDRFEGSVPEIIEKARRIEYQRAHEKGEIPPNGHTIHAEINKCLRRFTYLNCWHMKEEESVAMWEKYGGSDRAVAIRSTIRNLRRALDGHDGPAVYFAEIEYRPYSSENESGSRIEDIDIDEELKSEEGFDSRFFITRDAHSLVPFVYKRTGFEYEEEMRSIIQSPPINDELDNTIAEIDGDIRKVDFKIYTEDGPKYIDTTQENERDGLDVDIWIHELINKVHVAPDADDWFKQTVEGVIRQCDPIMDEYGLEDVLEESIMDHGKDPLF